MNFILSVFRNLPGKIVLYGWIYPAILYIVIMLYSHVSGCQGGFIDTPLECAPGDPYFYKTLIFPQMYVLLGTLYLFFTWPLAFVALITALIQAIRARFLASRNSTPQI